MIDRYGPPEVLRVEEVVRPVPADDEVLVKVHASTVNRSDTGLRSAEYFISRFFVGFLRPKQRITGLELAGEVVEAGAAVSEYAPGDRVFGMRSGAHAEFVCVREAGALAPMPAGASFAEAAAASDGASIALTCLRKAGPVEGRRILVYGASGAVGTAGVQLAKHLGAEVTAVCDTKHVELVRSLGADEVIDYLQRDFTKSGERYDVVFDAVGKHSFRRSRRALKPGGLYVSTDGLLNLARAVWPWRRGGKRAALAIARYPKSDILLVKELLEAGTFRPVIDRTYPLADVVEAHRYVETGQKTGNVVLAVA